MVQNIQQGQEVIFEEFIELRELFFLGKKKWYQLLIGKSFDMTLSGIVSETLSKQIIELVKDSLPKLIAHG